MAEPEPVSEDEKIIRTARERRKDANEGWREIYEKASEDMEFVYDVGNGQWPSEMRKEREADRRPVLTVNKIQKFVRTLRGDALQNRPRMKVIPVDSRGDTRMAKLYGDLIREIEYLSNASNAYDTGYGHAIASSVGFYRIITEFSDWETFDQHIRIKRIINPPSVLFDASAVEFEMEDARYCFVETLFDKVDFERKWPDANVADFTGENAKLFGSWLQGDKIRVAEYFYKEPAKRELVQLDNGEILTLSEQITPEFIKSKGNKIIRHRTVDAHVVKWVKMNGIEVLEKADWPGKDIPIIPIFGDEIVVNGKRYYISFTRGARGSQEMYNYWATAATETVALAPKMPFIVDHRQIDGFEKEWDEANRTNRMYLRYNAIQGMTKPTRERAAEIPSAIMAMMRTTAFDIEDHLGRYESSKGEASNERSRVAIVERIRQSDKGTYLFVDNLKKAIMAGTRQLIDLIPKVYDTPRALRVMDEGDNERIENVNVPVIGMGGENITENDLSVGKYDLIATVGTSFGSKREEMADTMIKAMQFAPMLAPVIAPLVFKFSDVPGAEEIYKEVKAYVEKVEKDGGFAGGKSPKNQPPKR
jgi:hypothetical protein